MNIKQLKQQVVIAIVSVLVTSVALTSATYASEKRMLLVVTKLILLFPSEDTYKVSSICLCVKG